MIGCTAALHAYWREVGKNDVARGSEKRVKVTLSGDFVREAQRLTNKLSETIEVLLTAHLAAELHKREDKARRIENNIDMAIAHFEEFGVTGEEHSPV